jgi:integrase
MAKKINKLDARTVATAKKPGLLNDGGGLYLRVAPGGSKQWIFRYKVNKKTKDAGLGSVNTFSLAEARDRARQCRKLIDAGQDPIAHRKAARAQARLDAAKAMTFRACAEAYIAAQQPGWRNPKHAAQWPATLEAYVYPTFGALPVQAVDVGLVMKALEPIWTVKPETASRVRGRIESVLNWATARGYRTGENPARWRGHLENLLPKRSKVQRVEHHAALPYAELADFMTKLRRQEGVAARALEFAVLTAARTSEAIGAKWAEIDFGARLWTVPAERMKGGKEHRVPLSDRAIEILEEMQTIRDSDFVFRGSKARRPLSNMSLLMLLRRMGRSDLTTHGFRSTFSDWCSERTNFAAEAREMALAHIVGDRVEAAYRRGDLFEKRRQLMGAWEKFCAVSTPAVDRVVSLRGAA